ncbi:hypothetical protein [Prochlorococcus marinus]|uniref:hypothetical protein n=1 Tax=Prochlorococcus marinus TaxID=1219 RepID=UPI0039AFA018
MQTKQLCLNLGDKNKDLYDQLDQKRDEWDLSFPDTVTRLIREHRFYEELIGRQC